RFLTDWGGTTLDTRGPLHSVGLHGDMADFVATPFPVILQICPLWGPEAGHSSGLILFLYLNIFSAAE
ncbi:hypothetical protein, partial [Serratia marcescens]|uniref:hypothetical protein n=1 Tax=Serratia marcescens TaxID=615 RepID=UPI002812C1B5